MQSDRCVLVITKKKTYIIGFHPIPSLIAIQCYPVIYVYLVISDIKNETKMQRNGNEYSWYTLCEVKMA